MLPTHPLVDHAALDRTPSCLERNIGTYAEIVSIGSHASRHYWVAAIRFELTVRTSMIAIA